MVQIPAPKLVSSQPRRSGRKWNEETQTQPPKFHYQQQGNQQQQFHQQVNHQQQLPKQQDDYSLNQMRRKQLIYSEDDSFDSYDSNDYVTTNPIVLTADGITMGHPNSYNDQDNNKPEINNHNHNQNGVKVKPEKKLFSPAEILR